MARRSKSENTDAGRDGNRSFNREGGYSRPSYNREGGDRPYRPRFNSNSEDRPQRSYGDRPQRRHIIVKVATVPIVRVLTARW